MHTLEPTFFKRVLKEHYDAHRQAKMKEKGDQILVSSSMLNIIKAYRDKNSFARPIAKRKRAALAALKVGKTKKKRVVLEKKPLTAKLGAFHVPAALNSIAS